MKILHVLNEFRDGGAELGLADLVASGFFAGHELAICALAQGRGTVRSRLIQLVGPDRMCSLTDEECLRDTALPTATARLAMLFMRARPDVIILSLPQTNLVGRIAATVVPRAVVVSFEHSIEYRRNVARLLMSATAPLVDAYFYDHPESWRRLCESIPRLNAKEAHYVPLTSVEPMPAPVPIPQGRRHCVTTMRLEPGKNPFELFRAVRILVDAGYDLDLTVAGDGPLRGDLERLITELDLSDRIIMRGFVERPCELLRSCDTYVMSSVREGLSRSVVEAMAAGLLVVSTDVGAISDYGVHGENMIKARGASAVDLAAALGTAIDLGCGARRLQEGALRTVEREFSGKVVSRRWSAAIQAVENAAVRRVQATG